MTEASIREEHLTKRQRGCEEDLCHEHDPEQVEVQLPLCTGEARRDDLRRALGEDEEQDRPGSHHHDAERQHGPREAVGIGDAGLRGPQSRKDRDEGRREPGLDEDVEQQLGQLERRVVGVELGTRAEGAGEHALTEQADDYLTKPFDVRELLARIANIIATRRRLRERFAGTPLTIHPAPVDVPPADRKFVDVVRTAIEAHLGDEQFTVERLAAEVAQSRGNLHRRMRELLGETPSDLIRRMRLERAAAMLEAGAGSVSEVAYAVGFKSVAHFSNAFHEMHGVRPSAWRARAPTRGVVQS